MSATEIALSWRDNSSNEEGFQVERAPGEMESFTEIATVGPNVMGYTSTGLTEGTGYSYRVRAYNGAGTSDYTNTATAATQLSVSEQPIFKAPWRGNATVIQGNHGTVSHNTCHNRSLDPDNCNWENSYAIDVAQTVGADVLAPADGLVSFVKDDPSGSAGRQLAIDVTGPRGTTFKVLFAHLSQIIVSAGAVCQGSVIAKSGASSDGNENGTSPHLHFHIFGSGLSLDSHTRPIEQLLMRDIATETDFRLYDEREGDLEDSRIKGHAFESNNLMSCPPAIAGTYTGPVDETSEGLRLIAVFTFNITQLGAVLGGDYSVSGTIGAESVTGTGTLSGTIAVGTNPEVNLTSTSNSCPNFSNQFRGTYDGAQRVITLAGTVHTFRHNTCTLIAAYPNTVITFTR